MRTLLPQREEEIHAIRPTLRTDRPAAAYARRSDPKARDEEKDDSQSREMQTEDMIAWAEKQGWKRRLLFEYFKDLGLSGTLSPDQRDDMLRLFTDIDAGKYDHGTVICWQENRLFRDETQIYYNQFIQKCKEHDINVVVVSPYLMIYDFRDEFLTEMFRWKCKEAGEFIKRHVKGWMLPARLRAALIDGEWAGLGDPPTGFIVDFDEKSPTYKKLIPYWPHAEKKREIRLLFVELGCNISLLYKRLWECPVIFPEFEEWVDPRNVNHFKMSKHPSGGYYPKTKSAIVRMLTDPSDLGYRVINNVIRRNSKGEKIRNHDPIVDRELFDLSYYPLAKTDLDGNPISGNMQRRYFRQGNKGEYGLLKFRLKSHMGEVRTRSEGQYAEDWPPVTGVYAIEGGEENHRLHQTVTFAVFQCVEVDTIVVNRLLEHVRDIVQKQQDIAEYEQSAVKQREQRERQIKQIQTSIHDIAKEQGGLTRSLGKAEMEIEEAEESENEELLAIKQRRKQLIEEQIDILERERQRLLKTKRELEEEADTDLGTLEEELAKLEALWPEYSFEKRRSLLNFVTKEVMIDVLSTHWVRIQVIWLHEEWGLEEFYYRREIGSNKRWTHAELAIVREHYETTPRLTLMKLLPDRGWTSIGLAARTLVGIKRKVIEAALIIDNSIPDREASYADIVFMQSMDIPFAARNTNWMSQWRV